MSGDRSIPIALNAGVVLTSIDLHTEVEARGLQLLFAERLKVEAGQDFQDSRDLFSVYLNEEGCRTLIAACELYLSKYGRPRA